MNSSGLRGALSRALPLVRLAGVGIAVVVAVDLFGVWFYRDSRHAVVDVMRRLHKGMPEAEASELLRRYEGRFFLKQPCGRGVQYWAHADFVHAWNLCVTFDAEGRLDLARVWTEDGPYHPRGVPPDIH